MPKIKCAGALPKCFQFHRIFIFIVHIIPFYFVVIGLKIDTISGSLLVKR